MAEEDQGGGERTEEPTPRRLEKAHQKGQIARSQELTGAAILLAGTGALVFAGGASLADFFGALMVESTRLLSAGSLDLPTTVALLRMIVQNVCRALVPLALGLVAVALMVNLIQAQGVFSLEPVTPKLEKVSPLNGLKRVFSWQSPFSLIKSIFKLAALSAVTYVTIKYAWPQIVALSGVGSASVATLMKRMMALLALATGLVFLLLSAADYLFQAFQHRRKLRMTRHEVLQEYKDTEGDPLIKSRIRSLAIAMSRKRMLTDVQSADVVVTNPTHLAVALKYDLDLAPAPVVLAMGQRKLAERIKSIAKDAGIPVVENRPLAQALVATATVGRPIPPALYTAVAEVIAFVYRQRNRMPNAVRNRTVGRTV